MENRNPRHVPKCPRIWTGAWPAKTKSRQNFNEFEMYLQSWPQAFQYISGILLVQGRERPSTTFAIGKLKTEYKGHFGFWAKFSTSGLCLLVSKLCTHEHASTLSMTICCLLSLGIHLKEIWRKIEVSVYCGITPACWKTWHGIKDQVMSPCRLVRSRDPSGFMLQNRSASPIFGLTDRLPFAHSDSSL
jgi:hypothetical protein